MLNIPETEYERKRHGTIKPAHSMCPCIIKFNQMLFTNMFEFYKYCFHYKTNHMINWLKPVCIPLQHTYPRVHNSAGGEPSHKNLSGTKFIYSVLIFCTSFYSKLMDVAGFKVLTLTNQPHDSHISPPSKVHRGGYTKTILAYWKVVLANYTG